MSRYPPSPHPQLLRWPGFLTCEGTEDALADCPLAFTDSYWDVNDQYICAADAVLPYRGLQVQCDGTPVTCCQEGGNAGSITRDPITCTVTMLQVQLLNLGLFQNYNINYCTQL